MTKLVEICWIDATGADAWSTEKELKDVSLTPVKTVGYLFREDETSYLLTMTWDDERENFGAYICIPKGMITSVRVIV